MIQSDYNFISWIRGNRAPSCYVVNRVQFAKSLYTNVFSNTCKLRCGVSLSVGIAGGCTSGLMFSTSHEHAWFSGTGVLVSLGNSQQFCKSAWGTSLSPSRSNRAPSGVTLIN